MGGDMRLDFPGLTKRVRGKAVAWRVRVEGNPNRKITLPVGPDHREFADHYRAARAGERLAPPDQITAAEGTMGWIVQAYLSHLAREVAAGTKSPLTLKERRNLAAFVLAQQSEQRNTRGKEYRGLPMTIPAAELLAFQDRMLGLPGKARNVWMFMRAAYDHAVKRNLCNSNPFKMVDRPAYKSAGGATAWTLDDLAQFRERHPQGTMAHLWLSLHMFTACRIGDACILGRGHELRESGALWLSWQPSKKGSRPVKIPVAAPLERAIRAQKLIGPTYLLTAHGKPFASPEALRNRVQKWCAEAGLVGLSSHGIRKAAGELLALAGATQYEIMALHAHANATTSQIYTKGAEAARLGQMAVQKLEALEW
jgi:site-specific recombinase XerC